MEDKIKLVLNNLGLELDANLLSYLFGLIFAIPVVFAVIKKVKTFWKREDLLIEELGRYFDEKSIKKNLKLYVPNKWQTTDPSFDDESQYIDKDNAKRALPRLLKILFEDSSERYLLILADSGVGKTTLMINLFLKYKTKVLHKGLKNEIVLLPLGAPGIIQVIGEISDKRNTILILDAFDEDIEATKDYQSRLNGIMQITRDFKKIIITCRTHFFPSDKEEPHRTGVLTHNHDGEERKFHKMYLCLFDKNDINTYLRKKYGLNFNKRRKAKEIIDKIPNLAVRPMLISYIDDLMDINDNFKYSYKIYELLIRKWIHREANKPKVKAKYSETEKYEKFLYTFSRNIALDMYKNRKERNGFYVTTDDDFGAVAERKTFFDIIDTEIELNGFERKTGTLLNRNSEGKYKFSHKSFLEYFLALELIDNSQLLRNFDFKGMDLLLIFAREIISDLKDSTKDIVKQRNLNVLNSIFLSTESYNRNNEDRLAILNRAHAYYELKLYEKAISDYLIALSLNNSTAQIFLYIGNCYFEITEYNTAIKYITESIKLKSTYVNYYLRGVAYYIQEDYANSLKDLSGSIRLIPREGSRDWFYENDNNLTIAKYEDVYFYRALVYRALKKNTEAMEDLNAAIKINDSCIKALYERGLLNYDLGNFHSAINDLIEVDQIQNNYRDTNIKLGTLFEKINEKDNALVWYSKAIDEGLGNHNLYKMRGELFIDTKKFLLAVNDFTHKINIGDKSFEIFYLRGQAYWNLKRYKEAIEDFNQIINGSIEQYKGYYYKALCYTVNDYLIAVEDLDLAYKCNPDFSKVFLTRGLMYAALGQYEKSKSDFVEASKTGYRIEYINKLIHGSNDKFEKFFDDFNSRNATDCNIVEYENMLRKRVGEYK